MLCCITTGGSFIARRPSRGVMIKPLIILHGLDLDCPSMVMVDCVEALVEVTGISRTCPTAGSTNDILDWSSMIASPS